MAAQTITLAGKKFVIMEQQEFLRLKRKAEEISEQDRGDVAESKRRLAEPGESISWERIKAQKAGSSATRRKA